ncbi:MAG: hypothetical protein AAFN78_04755 [Pseudomonadota bacterium]
MTRHALLSLFRRAAIAMLLTAASTASLANDLIVTSFTIDDITRDGVSVLSQDPVWFVDDGNAEYRVAFTAKVTWACGSWSIVTQSCSEVRPSTTVDLALEGNPSGERHNRVAVDLPATSIAWRGYGPLGLLVTGEELQSEVVITDAGFAAFVTTRLINGDALDMVLRVDPDNTVPEDTPDNTTNRATAPINSFAALSGLITFGPASATLTALDQAVVSPCGGPDSVTLVGADITWNPGVGFAAATATDQTLCANYSFNGATLDLDAREAVDLGPIDGTLGGFDITLADNTLLPGTDPTGGGGAPGALGFFTVVLPDGVTYHLVDFYGNPLAAGASQMLFLATEPAYGSYTEIEGQSALGHLASEFLPFTIRNASATLNAAGFTGTFDNVHYRYDMVFQERDPRGNDQRGVVSNDRRFSQPTALAAAQPYSLTELGLQIDDMQFDLVDNARLHYPRSRADFETFSVDIVDNRVADNATLPAADYRIALSGDCAECESGVDDPVVRLEPTAERLASDGSVMAIATLDLDPAWGPADVNGDRIFQRNGDAGTAGVNYVPGWIASGTGGADGLRTADWLTGARQALLFDGTPAPATAHFLQDSASQLGNYFFAGLTMGPEIYSDATGQPITGIGTDLGSIGSSTSVGFGGLDTPAFYTISSNAGTKYVLRKSGVTGVFNTSDSFTPNVYGYALDIDRFAFRQVANVIDTENWFDGRVYIPGKGDFTMYFENLDLDCNGNVGAGWVVEEACDGVGFDRNCYERFAAWEADVDLQSMAFVPDNLLANACLAQDRELWVGNTMDFRALDDPLGIVGAWTPGGDVELISLTGVTDHVVDRPANASGDDDQGFAVAFDGDGVLGTPNDGNTDGYLKAGALIGVPLWEALDVDVRLANDDNTTPSQTIVAGAGVALGADDDNQTNAELGPLMRDNGDIDASYTWGASSFGFDLPVYYDAGRYTDGEHPRFLGQTLGSDLVVFEANAGVDFIHPDSTKLSFGASADFEALELAAFDLNVDLSDPESIASIDAFLCSPLGVCTDPVAGLVGAVQFSVDGLNGMFDAGFDAFIEAGIRAGIDEIGIDPFVIAAEAVGRVQAVPEQFASIGLTAFEELIIDMLAPLDVTLEAELLDVYLTLPGLLVQAEAVGGPVSGTLAADLSEIRAKLALGEDALDAVLAVIDTASGQVDQAVLAYDALINDIVGEQTQAAIDALDTMEALLPDPLPTGAACGIPDFDSPSFNGPAVFEQLYTLGVGLLDARTALQVANVVDFATTVAVVTGVDTELARSAQTVVDELSEEVELQINEALVLMENLCGDLPAQSVLTDVNTVLTDLRDAMVAIRAAVLAMESQLTDPASGIFAVLLEELAEVRGQVAGAKLFVVDLRIMTLDAQDGFPFGYDFTGLGEAEIKIAIDEILLELTGGRYTWHYNATLFDVERTFIAEMALDLRQPVDELIAQAAFIAQQPLNGLDLALPHPTADDLITLIVDTMMNAPVIEDFDVAVNALLTEAVSSVNDIALDVFDQVNFVIKDIVEQLEGAANDALAAASAAIPDMPVTAAGLDGYAVVQGDELERLHIGAEWTQEGDEEDTTSTYGAALDVTSWSAANKGSGCSSLDTSSLFDAVISAYGLPIRLGTSDAAIKEVYLGFTMADNPGGSMAFTPAGIFGGLSIDGTIDFEAMEIYDVAFAAGVSIPGSGLQQSYLGATASASFDSLSMQAGYLVGKTCDLDVLKSLDPQVADFIETPGGVFNGVYARGSASIPIWNNGCVLTVGVSGDVGAWLLAGPPVTVGGLVGGGAYGKVACIAALRGQVTTLAQKSGDNFSFQGEGFGVAGAGFCEPEKWTTVPKSREDGGCGTGDAQFKATFDNGWDIGAPKPSAIH